jgi:hypothetical protein
LRANTLFQAVKKKCEGVLVACLTKKNLNVTSRALPRRTPRDAQRELRKHIYVGGCAQ